MKKYWPIIALTLIIIYLTLSYFHLSRQMLYFGLAICGADLLTGVVHWLEDAYGNPNWKYLGKSVIAPNLEHHKSPRNIVKNGYWATVETSYIIGLMLIVLTLCFSICNLYTLLSIVIAAHGNMTHKWAHQTDKENGRFITWLHRNKILITRRNHGLHHKAPYVGNYCSITNFVNPVLDFLYFWPVLEFMIRTLFRVKVLRGSLVRNGL